LPPQSQLHSNLIQIKDAARRSADLTRQLLAFARRQTVTPRVLDLNETLEGMLKMLRRLIGEDIDLVWLPGRNLSPVKIDPSQLDQILANLSVNARDAIGKNIGKITIETKMAILDEDYCAKHAECVPGEYVMLAMSDDGSGMSQEILPHIFEPFFTTKPVGQGTGLGLATVYGIVKQNKGSIDVASEPGKGATFRIYLPLHAVEINEALEQTEADAKQQQSNITILLVEDETSLLEITRTSLERQGYGVLPAASPREAIRLAHKHSSRIHLLITDIIMPEMNGRELARKLLALQPNMKCLFVSGYSTDVISDRGVLEEGVSFLQKPFAAKDLFIKVREIMAPNPDR
jgi:two-component system, cell cycle sensor histidine kinase and response regulator CckA